jgi:DNA mismatch repair protein MutS
MCEETNNESIRRVGMLLDPCTVLRERIEKQIQPDPPFHVNKGNVIANGVNAELDELR